MFAVPGEQKIHGVHGCDGDMSGIFGCVWGQKIAEKLFGKGFGLLV